MYRQVPNFITVGRLVLTAAFFVALNHTPARGDFGWWMWGCFSIFVVAALTDVLDGYLARSWKVESAFGRVVDPFVDKILICGAFVFLASPDFLGPRTALLGTASSVAVITGIAPWMAVVLIAREFLVTGIRGLAESRGIDFRAQWTGKVKMFAQSVAVGAALGNLATAVHGGHYQPLAWILWSRDVAIWVTLAATVLSAVDYIVRAGKIITQ